MNKVMIRDICKRTVDGVITKVSKQLTVNLIQTNFINNQKLDTSYCYATYKFKTNKISTNL